jgi:hypothetical protein
VDLISRLCSGVRTAFALKAIFTTCVELQEEQTYSIKASHKTGSMELRRHSEIEMFIKNVHVLSGLMRFSQPS